MRIQFAAAAPFFCPAQAATGTASSASKLRSARSNLVTTSPTARRLVQQLDSHRPELLRLLAAKKSIRAASARLLDRLDREIEDSFSAFVVSPALLKLYLETTELVEEAGSSSLCETLRELRPVILAMENRHPGAVLQHLDDRHEMRDSPAPSPEDEDEDTSR